MKLKGPIAKMFGFSSKDHDKPGQFISGPITNKPGVIQPYARHSVPFIQQTHVNLCGDACINMLLAFLGKPHKASLDKNPRGTFKGLTTDDVSDQLTAAGVSHFSVPFPPNFQWTPTGLAEYLQRCGPIICAGSMHFVLLIGIHEQNVFIHDPWRGANMTKSLSDFNGFLNWSDDDCMIAAAPR